VWELNRKFKSYFYLLLGLVFIIALVACSGEDENVVNDNSEASEENDTSENNTNDNANEPSESEEEVTLDIFSWRSGDTEEFDQIISKFNEEYPNININFDPTTAPEYDSALNTQLSTDTGADIFFVRPFALGKNIYEAGHLEVITGEDIESINNIADIQKDIYTSDDGNLYAVPFNYVSYGFLYNKTMFDENGWEEPNTWDEFFELLEEIQSENITPLSLGTADAWVVDEIVASGFYPSFVGGEDWRLGAIDGDNKLTDSEYVSFLENLTKWPEYMPNNFEGIGYVDALQFFMAEKAAIWVTGSWALTDIDMDEIDFELDMFASPVVNEGDKRWVGFNGGAGLGINPKSEHIDEAKVFLNWLMSDTAQSMIVNLLPGQFPVSDIPEDLIESEVNKKWLEVGGENGENYATGLAFDVFNGGDPTLGTLQIENITALLNGDLSPQETAENIQTGLETWYEPFQ